MAAAIGCLELNSQRVRPGTHAGQFDGSSKSRVQAVRVLWISPLDIGPRDTEGGRNGRSVIQVDENLLDPCLRERPPADCDGPPHDRPALGLLDIRHRRAARDGRLRLRA